MQSNYSESPRHYHEVDAAVEQVLAGLGYDVEQNISAPGSSGWLMATVGGALYNVNIVVSNTRQVEEGRIGLGKPGRTMYVVAGVISDGLRARLAELFPNEIVLDLRNLLHLVGGDRLLRAKLVSVLNYAVDDVRPLAPDPRYLPDRKPGAAPDSSGLEDIRGSLSQTRGFGTRVGLDFGTSYSAVQGKTDRLFGECRPGRADSAKFESLCCGILRTLFGEDLTLWREQQKSDSDLFRFDLICKIKRDNRKDFWETAERYFASKYIVFEFKNYSGFVTQKEIFTTVKYLYGKALRGIAIIVSPNGTDAHADMAIRGILRDEGKLILSLSEKELEKMLAGQGKGIDPADYLSEKLDDLLIDLEK